MTKKWHISRRRMLKGMGACIALPYLEAMSSPTMGLSSGTPKSPVRSAFLFMPNGVHPDQWTPNGYGNDFELSPILSPLEKFKKDILVLGELMNKNSNVPDSDGHYAKTANLLTCLPIAKTTGENIDVGGPSVDQLMAQKIGDQTLFPSLEYGLDRIKTGVDANVGYTLQYASSISWKSPSTPQTKEIEPKLAFERLFAKYVPGKKIKEDPWKQSILDAVMEDANNLSRNLGRADQDKLTEYMESIRSVEKRIQNSQNKEKFESNLSKDLIDELTRMDQRIDEYEEMYSGIDVTEKTRLILDIMALAFWSDATRVTSLMFGNSVSGRNFSFLDGVNGNHHSLSHHQNNEETMNEYARINRWHIEQYAYFINKLKSYPDGESNLLDQSMIMFASGIRDGNRHSPRDLPIVIAGKGGGKLATGQNLKMENDTPLANLYLSMLHGMNIEMDQFADSTGTLSNIEA